MSEKEILASIEELVRTLEKAGHLEGKWSKEFGLKISESSLDKLVPEVKADFYIPIKDKIRVFLEIEKSGGRIDINVDKYWPWLARNWHEVCNKKIILIHLLNPRVFKDRNWLSGIEIAKFMAGKIKDDKYDFEYILVDDLPEENWETVAFERIKGKIEELLSYRAGQFGNPAAP